tara:strand:- start:213 stop:458 length:246 start_codon:yes stop_codon:yes gene_type:complete
VFGCCLGGGGCGGGGSCFFLLFFYRCELERLLLLLLLRWLLFSNSQAHHFRGFAYLVTEGRDLPDSGGKKRWVERVFLEKR